MLHKIFVNILSILNIINFVLLVFAVPVVQDMYASYGATYQLPTSLIILAKFKIIFLILIALILCYIIFFNVYFNKKVRIEKPEKYKNVSIMTYVFMGVLYIITTISFILFILKPIIELYMGSFLFEANGI